MPVTFRTTGRVSAPEFFVRRNGGFRFVQMPVTCAIVERPDGLLLIDTGWSRAQCAWPEQDPGRATKVLLGLKVRAEDALASQLISLGYDPGEVRHIVATHLHIDHVGGVADFPHARVHASAAEWAERTRGRRAGYDPRTLGFAHRLELHALKGPPALGFPASEDLLGDGSVLLLDARGHTRGSVAVAVRLEDRWLLHVGDACMFTSDYSEVARARPTLYARFMSQDLTAQQRTFDAIRAAEREHGATVVPSHDPEVFASLPTTIESAWRTAWDKSKRKKAAQQNID